jgi:hypothetical protein
LRLWLQTRLPHTERTELAAPFSATPTDTTRKFLAGGVEVMVVVVAAEAAEATQQSHQ